MDCKIILYWLNRKNQQKSQSIDIFIGVSQKDLPKQDFTLPPPSNPSVHTPHHNPLLHDVLPRKIHYIPPFDSVFVLNRQDIVYYFLPILGIFILNRQNIVVYILPILAIFSVFCLGLPRQASI